MEPATWGLIFVLVWLGVVFLYCIFKAFGGRLADCFSCDCFRGPCCSCWGALTVQPATHALPVLTHAPIRLAGAGGTIDRFDREYPLRRYPGAHNDPYALNPYGPQQAPSQLPPIVVVNSMKDKRSRRERDGSSSEYSSDDDDGYPGSRRGGDSNAAVPGRAVVRDPELRNEAGGALLLRSSRLDSSPGIRNQPMVL